MGFEDLDYTTIADVIDSWEQLRRTPDYALTAGTLLFSHLFSKFPRSKVMFGFPIDMDSSVENLKKSRRFAAHAVFMIDMLDRSLNLLGPDAELLEEIMADLGKRHVAMGIDDVSYYTAMGESLNLTLEETIGEDFTPKKQDSWKIVYGELSGAMTRDLDNPAK